MEGNERTDLELRTVAMEVRELPELKARWVEEDERNRALYKHLWHNTMGGLENLEDKHREGKMTPEQVARYRELKHLLKEAIPILKQLRFTLPPVPLDGA
jgi:hypothetical protein